jgi:hypothetical protein
LSFLRQMFERFSAAVATSQRAPLYFTNLRSLSGEPAKIGKKVGGWLAGDRFDQLKRREFR